MDYFRKKNIAISHFQSHYIDSEVIYRLFYRFTVSTSYLFGDKVCRSDFFQEPTVQLLTMHKITDIRVFSVVCNLFSFVSFSFSLSLVQSSKSLKWWINDLKQTEIVGCRRFNKISEDFNMLSFLQSKTILMLLSMW